MKFYFAPLEGITYPQYRAVHKKCFPGVDMYFSPFLPTGTYDKKYYSKHIPDIFNDIPLVPQIIANNSDAFIHTVRTLKDFGYNTVNLNVGCPSNTVFAKYKGSGMLRDLSSFDSFLADVFSQSEIPISVKTRLGVNSTDEFLEILPIYNKYPVSELIIHARDKVGMYQSKIDLDMFRWALHNSSAPICYNGDIFSFVDLSKTLDMFPDIDSFMIGRGVVANPALIRILQGGSSLSVEEFDNFHRLLVDAYLDNGLSPFYTAERMKNLWQYMICLFGNSEKEYKSLKKSKGLDEYYSAYNKLIHNCSFNGNASLIPW